LDEPGQIGTVKGWSALRQRLFQPEFRPRFPKRHEVQPASRRTAARLGDGENLERVSGELKVQAAPARVAAGEVADLEDSTGDAGLLAGIKPQKARDLAGTLPCLDHVTPATHRQGEKKGTHSSASSLTAIESNPFHSRPKKAEEILTAGRQHGQG